MSHNVARVHYEIDDDLHRECKAEAALDGLTLKDFVVRALRNEVVRSKAQRQQGTDNQ